MTWRKMNVRTRASASDVRSVVGVVSVKVVGSSFFFFRHGNLGILCGGIHEVLSLLRDQSKRCLIFRLVSIVIQLRWKVERVAWQLPRRDLLKTDLLCCARSYSCQYALVEFNVYQGQPDGKDGAGRGSTRARTSCMLSRVSTRHIRITLIPACSLVKMCMLWLAHSGPLSSRWRKCVMTLGPAG